MCIPVFVRSSCSLVCLHASIFQCTSAFWVSFSPHCFLDLTYFGGFCFYPWICCWFIRLTKKLTTLITSTNCTKMKPWSCGSRVSYVVYTALDSTFKQIAVRNQQKYIWGVFSLAQVLPDLTEEEGLWPALQPATRGQKRCLAWLLLCSQVLIYSLWFRLLLCFWPSTNFDL